MAMAFTYSVLENSARNFILEVVGVDTATTTAWTQTGSTQAGIIASNGYTPTTSLKVRRVVYNTTGCMARLQWHQTSNAELANFSGYSEFNIKTLVGNTQGFINPKGAGSTGDIDLSVIATSLNTAGTVTAAMTLVLECIKGVGTPAG